MKEKTYTYDPKRYAVRITYTGYFAIFILLYAIYNLFASKSFFFIPVIVVCLYIIWETFITLANPSQVIISSDKIIFKHKDKEDAYQWKDIHDFRVKDFPTRKQVYIRINKDEFSLFKGRYWLYCRFFSDGDELFQFVLNKEMKIHPNTVKSYARRGSKPSK